MCAFSFCDGNHRRRGHLHNTALSAHSISDCPREKGKPNKGILALTLPGSQPPGVPLHVSNRLWLWCLKHPITSDEHRPSKSRDLFQSLTEFRWCCDFSLSLSLSHTHTHTLRASLSIPHPHSGTQPSVWWLQRMLCAKLCTYTCQQHSFCPQKLNSLLQMASNWVYIELSARSSAGSYVPSLEFLFW